MWNEKFQKCLSLLCCRVYVQIWSGNQPRNSNSSCIASQMLSKSFVIPDSSKVAQRCSNKSKQAVVSEMWLEEKFSIFKCMHIHKLSFTYGIRHIFPSSTEKSSKRAVKFSEYRSEKFAIVINRTSISAIHVKTNGFSFSIIESQHMFSAHSRTNFGMAGAIVRGKERGERDGEQQ